jgi:hypothetical protein
VSWSKTPPNEPGYYWLKSPSNAWTGDERHVAFFDGSEH